MFVGVVVVNYIYWVYVFFLFLIQVVIWMDNFIEVYVNNSVWVFGFIDDCCFVKLEE